jgi:hypothetical protein
LKTALPFSGYSPWHCRFQAARHSIAGALFIAIPEGGFFEHR